MLNVWCSSMVALKISGGVQHNMACTKLCTREFWHICLVKLAQEKVKQMTKEAKKVNKITEVDKTVN